MTVIGAVCLPQLPPERFHDLVRTADEAGLAELWLWEDCFLGGGVATASAALAWSSRLRVGVGLLPVPLRNVALTAMELATLHRLFPGRVQIGVGHGVQDWMGQVGARVKSPMTLLREHVTALRGLLDGDRVTTAGRYVQLDGVALDWPPESFVPILVGASAPRTLELAATAGDGVILAGGTTPGQVRAARETLGDGQLVVYLHAATGADAAERLERERVRWSYPTLDDRAVAGDAAAITEQVRRWASAGADTVVLQPTPDDPDPEGFLRFVAGLSL
ncbi:LLM class flavin-dependent oxidoreductase [Actinoplanes derwentensis]|uniref:Flavin-dependent oxidoreductase, luciferase family (Includes alkanesulfonate monooxygenase SsuD and methylene tetrahydromethanopterin reductase) n=1 Tax=Actinoplanes derwentensis TaxID=113562 RepID=A0A1H2BUV9_9ACTN|nr:LLM class flavin-dependent oxidoreductase [Actinoplanes derwentensis]GID83111.1 oxidoreductase [Actinoplanes derwentensis]SDT62001.1 Flavin-dependent oxidoreductase, luciferase family (includes alkanesulfonate monooxygenase SsuD and methylene tetrahydromethanopterin reductase) [Actinoplanes derwentensis]